MSDTRQMPNIPWHAASYNTEDGRSSQLIGHNVNLPVMHHLQRHEISGQRRATAIKCWSPGGALLSELIPDTAVKLTALTDSPETPPSTSSRIMDRALAPSAVPHHLLEPARAAQDTADSGINDQHRDPGEHGMHLLS